MPSVTQEWTHELPFMQQSVLLSAIRGPDGQPKYDPPKMLLRWYRRCILISALDKQVLETPYDQRGGSFTGPSAAQNMEVQYVNLSRLMEIHVSDYIRNLDGISTHFANKFRDAIQILGYKHPTPATREFWCGVYHRLVSELSLYPESEEQMDRRLGDNRSAWLETADPAIQN